MPTRSCGSRSASPASRSGASCGPSSCSPPAAGVTGGLTTPGLTSPGTRSVAAAGRGRRLLRSGAARAVWEGDPAVRGELEARLLTDEPVEQVAGRVGLPAPAVEAYGEVFFSVRPMRR